MLQSLGERCEQVPGVPPVRPVNHAHHQVFSVSKDDGISHSVKQCQVQVLHEAYCKCGRPVTFIANS